MMKMGTQSCMTVIYYEMMILVEKSEYYERLEKFFNQDKFLRSPPPSFWYPPIQEIFHPPFK